MLLAMNVRTLLHPDPESDQQARMIVMAKPQKHHGPERDYYA
jgi:hypothetical protein